MTPESHVQPWECVSFCPRCGVPSAGKANPFRCQSCDFLFFFNPAAAAAALILRNDGEALFIRRAKDPGKGMLAMPGGFIDMDETAEDAVRREVREEVGLEIGGLEFLCSHPNPYSYRGIVYPVLDLFFVARAPDGQAPRALDDVAGFVWLDPRRIDSAGLAFPSMRHAIRVYQGST
ncbi:MAG: NUDIX domain-containing protein [Verrucomicrobia bacterium]|nr:NUDIX domain-containing protein [Verrucomicrobiota bacterium]